MTSIAHTSFLGRRLLSTGATLLARRHLHYHGKVTGRYLAARNTLTHVQDRSYSDMYFTKKHEYVMMESNNVGRIGISEYAQEKLGDVVYVQLPEIGKAVEKDEEVAAVESVKAASEIYSPLSGQVTEVNDALESDCSLVNKSPMKDGWIYKLSITRQEELKSLLTPAAYKKFLEEEETEEGH